MILFFSKQKRPPEKFTLDKAGTVDFKNTPHGRGGPGPDSVDPRFPADLPFPVPKSQNCSVSRFGNDFPAIFPDFPGVFLGNAGSDPENSYSLSFLREASTLLLRSDLAL